LNPTANPNDSTTYVLTASYGCLTATDSITLATNCMLLPIELVSFSAACELKTIKLKWSTASEINNDYYSVERSGDAINFESIGTIDGSGSSATAHQYSFVDEQPLPGVNYYRLKQVDFDGTSTYSSVQSTICTSQLGLFVYPNPSHDVTHLQIQSSSSKEVSCVVASMSGEIVLNEVIKLSGPIDEILFDNSKVTPGIYDVMVFSCDQLLHTLLVIQ
jgi:hypothetical protein